MTGRFVLMEVYYTSYSIHLGHASTKYTCNIGYVHVLQLVSMPAIAMHYYRIINGLLLNRVDKFIK